MRIRLYYARGQRWVHLSAFRNGCQRVGAVGQGPVGKFRELEPDLQSSQASDSIEAPQRRLFNYLAPSESVDEESSVGSASAKATADNLRVA